MDLPAIATAALLALATVPAGAMPPEANPCVQPARREAGPGFAKAYARNLPSVVTIVVLEPRASARELGPAMFQSMPLGRPAYHRTLASGFVLAPDGEIVTSAHVVAGAVAVWVVLADGRPFPARVVGFDRRSDVALLKIGAAGLVPVSAAQPQRLCPGDPVAALGAPFGFDASLSAGIVSAFPRQLPGADGVPLVQTDVALNPGSSGGPLFDPEGRVVGMNSMIYSNSGIFLGVSFAVPIDTVLSAAAALRASGRVPRATLGARTQPMGVALAQAFGLDAPRGALVVEVRAGGPAALAGLRSGDVLLALNGKPYQQQSELEDAIAAFPPGQWAALDVWRQGGAHRVMVRPADGDDAAGAPVAAGDAAGEPRLGLALLPPRPGLPAGVFVEAATGSSLLAGLEPGDRISAINGEPVATVEAFDAALAAAGEAPVVALLVSRDDVALYIAVRRIGR